MAVTAEVSRDMAGVVLAGAVLVGGALLVRGLQGLQVVQVARLGFGVSCC